MANTGRILKSALTDLYDARIKQAWMQGYGEPEHQFEPFFNVGATESQDERGLYISGLGMWVQKNLGDGVTFDSIYQGYDTTITPYTYNLAVTLEQETVEDDPHGILGQQVAANLGQTGRYTAEYLAASVFNNGFTNTTASPWMAGGDTTYLFSTSHPILSGGTYANIPATPVDLTEAGLEASLLRLRKMQNARGLLQPMKGVTLVVPPDTERLAWQIVTSDTTLGTTNDDPNWLKGRVTVQVWDFLTDTDAWFVAAAKAGIGGLGIQTAWYWRIKPEFDRDNHFETGDRRYKGRFRAGGGWFDWRGWDGCTGA